MIKDGFKEVQDKTNNMISETNKIVDTIKQFNEKIDILAGQMIDNIEQGGEEKTLENIKRKIMENQQVQQTGFITDIFLDQSEVTGIILDMTSNILKKVEEGMNNVLGSVIKINENILKNMQKGLGIEKKIKED